MAHVFISYSRQNADYAERLVDALKAHNLDVWIDHSIEYGVNWSDEIFTAIRDCAAFIVIMSPDSRKSKWVQREVAYADEIMRPIFPILLEGKPWPLLLTMQHVNATDDELPSDEFFARLRELVSRAPDPKPEKSGGGSRLPRRGRIGGPQQTPVSVTTSAFGSQLTEESPPKPELRERRLETAMPACTPRKAESQLRVKISLPDSEGLKAELPDFIPAGDELHKSDVRGTGFRMRFGRFGARLQDGVACVEVISEHFDIISATMGEDPCNEDRVRLDVPTDTDSRTVIFALKQNDDTPQSGSARVYVRIYQDDKLIAESTVSTRMVTDVDTHPACELWKMALATVRYGAPPPFSTRLNQAAQDFSDADHSPDASPSPGFFGQPSKTYTRSARQRAYNFKRKDETDDTGNAAEYARRRLEELSDLDDENDNVTRPIPAELTDEELAALDDENGDETAPAGQQPVKPYSPQPPSMPPAPAPAPPPGQPPQSRPPMPSMPQAPRFRGGTEVETETPQPKSRPIESPFGRRSSSGSELPGRRSSGGSRFGSSSSHSTFSERQLKRKKAEKSQRRLLWALALVTGVQAIAMVMMALALLVKQKSSDNNE